MPVFKAILKHISTNTYRGLEPNPQTQTQVYTLFVKLVTLRSRFPHTPPNYMERFAGGSSSYLSQRRRTYRLQQNHSLLAVHRIQPEDIKVLSE